MFLGQKENKLLFSRENHCYSCSFCDLGATAVGLSASNSEIIKEIEAAFNDQAKITNDLLQKINDVKLAVKYRVPIFNFSRVK